MRRLLTSEFVKIFIGKTRREYNIHKSLLCNRSTYFDAAFNGKFSEAAKKELHIEDVYPEGFDMFVSWLYSERVPTTSNVDDDSIMNYYRLYVLADRFCLERLGNDTMDRIKSYYTQNEYVPSHLAILEIVDNAPEDCGLRKFLGEWFAQHFEDNCGQINSEMDKAGKERGAFAVEIMQAMRKKRKNLLMDPKQQNKCYYHQHIDTEPCSKSK